MQQETIVFLQEYEQQIYEKDFSRIFNYHVDKTRKEFLERIVVYYKNAEQDSWSLTIEHLLQQILTPFTKKNKENLLKLHCISILKTFDLLVNKIKNCINNTTESNLFNNEFIYTNNMHLRKLVIDANEFLMFLEKNYGDIPKKQIGFNRGVNGFDSNWFAGLLFNGIVDTSNFAFFINLVFLLRDSIELRIRNALGIINITKEDGKPAKISNSDFLDFLFKNKDIIVPKLNKALIKKIFEWCNYHIHKSNVLYEWQLVLSYEYVKPLFQKKETSTQISLFGSIEMTKDYYTSRLSNKLEAFLINKNLENQGIKITLMDKPEALLV